MVGGEYQDQTRPAILLIEDEAETAREVSQALEQRGYAVRVAGAVQQVSEAIRLHSPTVMILDRMLHGTDSLPMIEVWREQGDRIPILIVSGLSSVDDRIRGLKAGGDDYLVKPFSLEELIARVEVLRRPVTDARISVLRVGPLTMDRIERVVRRGERKSTLRRANSSFSNTSCGIRIRFSPGPCC